MKPGDLYGPDYGPTTKTGPGKGSSPRNNRSNKYRDNYESIDWGRKVLNDAVRKSGHAVKHTQAGS